jgi:hypothetical protein
MVIDNLLFATNTGDKKKYEFCAAQTLYDVETVKSAAKTTALRINYTNYMNHVNTGDTNNSSDPESLSSLKTFMVKYSGSIASGVSLIYDVVPVQNNQPVLNDVFYIQENRPTINDIIPEQNNIPVLNDWIPEQNNIPWLTGMEPVQNNRPVLNAVFTAQQLILNKPVFQSVQNNGSLDYLNNKPLSYAINPPEIWATVSGKYRIIVESKVNLEGTVFNPNSSSLNIVVED